ncbi:MAG: helix-turn-helix domain-containing protein [Lachnospiraceae bacterium]|nr:helix-turn-helix domain-containing protein [Lachnospiraceae bacterium]
MNLGSQIKKYRSELSMSQDELAEKIFVSRQSISNWENDKTYPDIKSLLLLSEVFQVSLDQLIKGDLEIMKKEISTQELADFQKDTAIMTVFFLLMLITPIPLAHFLGWWGMVVYVIIAVIGFYFALRVEKHKKKFDIQTYKEITAFLEGKSMDEIEKARESGKRPYQKVLAAVGSGVLVLVIAALMTLLFRVL